MGLPLQHGGPPNVVIVAPLAHHREDEEEECHLENNLTNFESRFSLSFLFIGFKCLFI
jgi:hypothetical protein